MNKYSGRISWFV